jgi:benzoate membrane transport protein
MVCAALITLASVTRWFEHVMNRMPIAIAAALLAGGAGALWSAGVCCGAVGAAPGLSDAGVYLPARRLLPRYAMVITLAQAIGFVALRGEKAWSAIRFELARPMVTAQQSTLSAAISPALLLFVVAMASKTLPGVAVIRASGYDLHVSRLITMTGLATLVLAPFGGYALIFSAITAGICTGPQAHPDRNKRYTAPMFFGLRYVAIGIFGAVVTGVLTAFPKELVRAIAGLALLRTIGNGLAAALRDEPHREAAWITFLVTLSGGVVAGVGSAFWGVVAGSLALFVQQYRRF